MSSSPQQSSSAAATTADNNNNNTNIDANTNNFSIIRGRIIRKRKYHDHISFAIRSLESSSNSSSSSTTPLPSPPILIMIPRNDPISFSLDGIFIGTIIEAKVEREIDETVVETEATAVVEAVTTTTTTEKENSNKSNNNKNNHQLAKSFKIIGCSPDPNAIQVCLNLVFGVMGDENENKPKKKLLPASIFSYYDDGGNNNNDKSACMIPLFLDDNDLQVILKILKLNSKDPILRKSFISRLSRALKGDDKEFTLVVENNDSSSGDAKTKNDGPRKRLTHVKHRQKLVLQKMEVSQSPLEHVLVRTITVDGEEDDEDDDDNIDHGNDEEKEPTSKSKVSSSSEPSSILPNIPKVVGPDNPNNGNGNTMNMMSIRHPRTRIEYLMDKKYPQIQWLLQRMSPIIDTIRNEQRRKNKNKNIGKEDKEEEQSYYINVLDVGGGRGDIAVAIAQEFHDVKVTVVDMNESSLQAGKDYYEESMKRNNCDNNTTDTVNDNDNNTDTARAHFICDDFTHFAKDAFNNNRNTSNNMSNSNSNRSSKATTFDIVIAWHACGDLSDYALEYSIRSNSVKAFLINPCCYTKRYIQTFTPKYISQYSNYCCSPVVVDNVDNSVNHDVNTANNANEVNEVNANNSKESAPEATTTTATTIATIATNTTNTTTPTTPIDNVGMTKNKNTNTNTTIMTTNEFKTKNNYNKNGSNSNGNSYRNSKNNNQQDNNQQDKYQQDKYQQQDKNQQQQQQVNSNNNDIKIIQKLAEINERPEYTSRAMRLINTMRIKSLLVLQNELNLNSKPSTTTTTATMIPTATATATPTATGTSSSSSSSLLFDITLEEYNIKYSSKNLVLVGINNNVC